MVKAYAGTIWNYKVKDDNFGRGSLVKNQFITVLEAVKRAHPNEDVTVLIHDGNRPLVSNDIVLTL